MRWQLKSALTGVMLIASVSMAQAVQIKFDFTLPGNGVSTESPFSITEDGVTVIVSAHSMDDNGNVTNEDVTRYSNKGIGITSGWHDQPQVDNIGPDEFIQFVFSENVSIVSAEFSYVNNSDNFAWAKDTNNSNTIDGNDYISPFIDIPGSGTYSEFSPDADNLKVFALGLFDNDGTATVSAFGNWWHKHHWPPRDPEYSWKVKNLTVEYTTPVPVPAALPLFGTGLALMGFIGWRRRRKLAAAA